MPIIRNEYNARSAGGTELSIGELESVLEPGLLSKFQIIPSRFRGLEPDLIPIYWIHDTETDPEMEHLANGGWKKFRKLVFVSNWQMQRFIDKFQIPWGMCEVLPNAINAMGEPDPLFFDGTIRFIYHTTPHRGLNVLVAAFTELAKTEDVHLDVYSSFSIYGWADRDKGYEPLYDIIRANPKMTFHGAKPNVEIREALKKTHAFVYPSIWPETGCRALIEAMMAGVYCCHTNFGCLYETGSGLTSCYQFDEDLNRLASNTYNLMRDLLIDIRSKPDVYGVQRYAISKRAHSLYSWDVRGVQWNNFLSNLL